jgi:hypothetical protein
MCLAEFAAWHNCVHHKSNQSNTEIQNDILAEFNFEPNVDDFSGNETSGLNQKEYQLKGGLVKDPENYFRETPWRNYLKDLLGTYESYFPMYESLEDLILKIKQQFQSDILEKAIEEISNKEDLENLVVECNQFHAIAPNTQHLDEQDQLAQKQARTEVDLLLPSD